MQALPDYMLIEFFNWIKTNENTRLNIGFVRECVMREKHTNGAMGAMDDLTPYAKEFIIQKGLNIEPWELVESIRAYLIYRYEDKEATERVESSLWGQSKNNKDTSHIILNGNEIMHMMTSVPVTLHTGIEFLEWLLKQEINADDVCKMPMCVFEQLARDFLLENEGVINDDLLIYLRHEVKDKTPMKCFFLPLAQDKLFEKFINNSWSDLNSLSKNYLDIYYSDKEFSISGYDIKDKIRSLEVAEDALPCLVLWVNSLETAKCVELRDLEYNDVFRLLQFIVQSIKVGDTFEVVCSKAVAKADTLRREHKEIAIIEQKFNISNSEIKNSQLGTFESELISKDEHENMDSIL